MSEVIRIKGFTNETLDWKAWLDVVNISEASAEQIASVSGFLWPITQVGRAGREESGAVSVTCECPPSHESFDRKVARWPELTHVGRERVGGAHPK
jgi:hypothetical protein